MMIRVALFRSPDLQAFITRPAVFWANLLAAGTIVMVVGFAYRFIFERLKMPPRYLPWTGIVIAYYLLVSPVSIIPQNYLLGDSTSEILPVILYSYQTYIPQAIFDIFMICLIFIALPSRYTRPLWYEHLSKLNES